MNQLPSIEKVVLILCDDFRNEGNEKMSIFGVYSDTLFVKIPDTENSINLTSLGIYVAFRDGVGNFKMSIQLSDPNNVNLLPVTLPSPVVKKPDSWMNVALKFMPFLGIVGSYKLNISLEDEQNNRREYPLQFFIKRSPSE